MEVGISLSFLLHPSRVQWGRVEFSRRRRRRKNEMEGRKEGRMTRIKLL
jgi:hypothetical protein